MNAQGQGWEPGQADARQKVVATCGERREMTGMLVSGLRPSAVVGVTAIVLVSGLMVNVPWHRDDSTGGWSMPLNTTTLSGPVRPVSSGYWGPPLRSYGNRPYALFCIMTGLFSITVAAAHRRRRSRYTIRAGVADAIAGFCLALFVHASPWWLVAVLYPMTVPHWREPFNVVLWMWSGQRDAHALLAFYLYWVIPLLVAFGCASSTISILLPRSRPRHLCVACGYDLRGNASASHCPECGHETNRNRP